MSFKYINPGYAEFISDKKIQQAIPDSNQSRTGIAFYGFNSSTTGLSIYDAKNSSTKILPKISGSQFWAKADFYNSNNSTIYFKQSYGSGIKINTSTQYSSDNYLTIYLGSEMTTLAATSVNDMNSQFSIRPNAINTLWLHVLLSNDSSVGYVEFQINNKHFEKFFGNTLPSGSTNTQNYEYFIVTSRGGHLSSVIISDVYISPYERVVPLAVSNTVTDMETLESGLYVADNASETLLQSVTTTSLANEYGSDAQVTGIALIGNPAYEVDDVIGSLTAITKYNGVLTERDKITLLTDSDAMIVSSFALPTDTTIADLADYQFGWRSEE